MEKIEWNSHEAEYSQGWDYFRSLLPLLCVGCFTPAGSSNESAHHEVSLGNNLSTKSAEENHDLKNETTNFKRAFWKNELDRF